MSYGQISADILATSTGQTIGASSSATMKNRIINGGMVIDQRNNGASGTAVGYTIDRWFFNSSLSTKGTWQQNAGGITPPSGFTNYLGFTSNSAYTLASGDYFAFSQLIEGFNVADLAWGTANAKTVTLSFWVYSSLTGTFGGALNNSGSTRSYPFTYSIPTANTWTYITITIAGDTTGTWLTNNGRGINVNLAFGVGSTYSGTAGSWSSNNYVSATGATSVVGTLGATFYITGVQLEVGTEATSFDYRDYGRELMMCQRYYQILPTTLSWGQGANSLSIQWNPIVQMRTTPVASLTTTSPYWENLVFISVGSITSATVNSGHLTSNGGDLLVSGTFSPTTSYGSLSKFGTLGVNTVNFSAEL